MDIGGLDDPCLTCERPSGDHTLREWAKCMGEQNFEMPMEAPREDAVAITNRELQKRFQLDPDTIVADNVFVYAATLTGGSGPLTFKVPALIHDFQTSAAGEPVTVAKIVFVHDNPDGMRAYGRLARDSANGAANAVERGR